MIFRRATALRPYVRQATTSAGRASTVGLTGSFERASEPASKKGDAEEDRVATAYANDPDSVDPGMNGGYVNPPAIKRALRDPYEPWWDKQERRNFGERVHEDNDILAVFSPEPYTHATPGKAAFNFLCFIGATLGLCGAVYQVYPDRPTVPREFPGGLEAELGGASAVPAYGAEGGR